MPRKQKASRRPQGHLGDVQDAAHRSRVRVTCIACRNERCFSFDVPRNQVSIPICSCGNGTWHEEAL
jgi:ribosomal protein S27E